MRTKSDSKIRSVKGRRFIAASRVSINSPFTNTHQSTTHQSTNPPIYHSPIYQSTNPPTYLKG
ncbi:MAG: hypothetical protein V9H69_13890 [Anaerolineae bacterium]